MFNLIVKVMNNENVNGNESINLVESLKKVLELSKNVQRNCNEPTWIDFGEFLKSGEIKIIKNPEEDENVIYESDKIICQDTTPKSVIHLFTSNGQSNLSNQASHLKAKAKSNILGFNKSKVELLNLDGCEIKNTIPEGDEDKMTYMSFDYNPDSNYDFIAATAGILELKNDKYHIGLVMMAYSYNDDLDGLSDYLEDSLMEVYQAGFNDYKIINFHITTEGFSPDKDYATVLAGIAF